MTKQDWKGFQSSRLRTRQTQNCLLYAGHHNQILITNQSRILSIHKERILWKNLLENKEMVFKNGAKIKRYLVSSNFSERFFQISCASQNFQTLKSGMASVRSKNLCGLGVLYGQKFKNWGSLCPTLWFYRPWLTNNCQNTTKTYKTKNSHIKSP